MYGRERLHLQTIMRRRRGYSRPEKISKFKCLKVVCISKRQIFLDIFRNFRQQNDQKTFALDIISIKYSIQTKGDCWTLNFRNYNFRFLTFQSFFTVEYQTRLALNDQTFTSGLLIFFKTFAQQKILYQRSQEVSKLPL